MIRIELSNTNPQNLNYWATKRIVSGVQGFTEGREIVTRYCQKDCTYVEKAFVNIGEAAYQNDKTDFAEQAIDAGDTITFKLYSSDLCGNLTFIEDIVDDSLGDFNAIGDITEYPLRTTWFAEWEKIAQANGFGYYRIEVVANLLGTERKSLSHVYWVQPYSDEAADGTVVLTSFQQGNIERSRLNWIGLNFQQQIRIPGRFVALAPEYSTDQYQDEERDLVDLQSSMKTNFQLDTAPIPSFIYNRLLYDNLLGDRLVITDYSINRKEDFLNVEVAFEEVEDIELHDVTKNQIFSFKFTDRRQDIIKRRVQ